MSRPKITSFNFTPGDTLLGKYEILTQLGVGWEGEVYRIREISTGIDRAAKFFFPQRNIKNKTSRFYAQKLHKLRACKILIHYHAEETIYIDGIEVIALISEYVEGELLSEFVNTFPGKRIPPFQALHLLYALCKGIESIHVLGEYHGDLHDDNIIVNRFGLGFELKLLDMFHWGRSTKANRDHDLTEMIRVFYDAMGGAKHYSRHPQQIKDICCGLRQGLILKKFPTVSVLRKHIEKLSWKNS